MITNVKQLLKRLNEMSEPAGIPNQVEPAKPAAPESEPEFKKNPFNPDAPHSEVEGLDSGKPETPSTDACPDGLCEAQRILRKYNEMIDWGTEDDTPEGPPRKTPAPVAAPPRKLRQLDLGDDDPVIKPSVAAPPRKLRQLDLGDDDPVIKPRK